MEVSNKPQNPSLKKRNLISYTFQEKKTTIALPKIYTSLQSLHSAAYELNVLKNKNKTQRPTLVNNAYILHTPFRLKQDMVQFLVSIDFA